MRLRAFFAVGAVLLAACGGSSGDELNESPAPASSNGAKGSAIGASCQPVVAAACKPGFHVSSAAEVIAASKAFDYQRVSISQGKTLEVGDDLIADEDLEVNASDLVLASECGAAGTGTSCHAPLFRAKAFPSFTEVPGVTCAVESADQPVRERFACSTIRIAKGATFRLRAVIEDMHPSAPNYWAYIDFVTPCTTSCGTGEVLCAATHTCFAAGYSSCTYCEGKSTDVCACRADACTMKPNGAECSFDSSPDVSESGTCSATGCRPVRR